MRSRQAGQSARFDSPALTRRDLCAVALFVARMPGALADVAMVPLALSEAIDLNFVKPLLETVGQAAKLRWQYGAMPFSRVLSVVEDGQAVGFGISPTEARTKQLDFSRPIFKGALWAISRRDRKIAVNSTADLHGRVVCMSSSADYGAGFDASVLAGSDLQPVSGDLSQRLRVLSAGHCDVLLVTTHNAMAAALKSRLQAAGGDPSAFVVSAYPLAEQAVHFAAAKDGPLAAWLPRIDAAIHARWSQIQQLVGTAG